MPVAFRSASSAAAQAASVTVNKPTGVVTDDIMVLFVITSANNTFTTPTGWTVLTASTSVMDGASVAGTVAAYYRFATAGEAASYTVTNAASGGISAAISAWSGVSKTTPIDASARVASTAATTSIATGTVTTTKAGSGIVIAACTAITVNSAVAVTYPTGTTKDSEALGTAFLSNNSGSAAGRENSLIATAGTVTTSRTLTVATASDWSAWTVALQQANVTYNQSAAATATFTAVRGAQQISKVCATAATFAAAFTRSLSANRSLAAAATLTAVATRAGTLHRSLTAAATFTGSAARTINAARAFTTALTATAVRQGVTVSTVRAAAMTPSAAFTRAVTAARAFTTAATLSTTFTRSIRVPRAYAASVAFTAQGRVDIAMSVLNRIAGGGTTIIKKVVNYIFDD